MTTDELLVNALEAAVEEQPLNKSLHRSIGSVLNRFYKSKENLDIVRELTSTDNTLGANISVNQESKNAGYVPYTSQKKTLQSQIPTYKPKPVVGREIDPKLKEIEEIAMKGAEGAEDEELHDENTNATVTENKNENEPEKKPEAEQANQIAEQSNDIDEIQDEVSESNEFLEMSTDEYLKMYGSLANLKKFASETLDLEFARNATADVVVDLIKQKISEEDIDS